MLKKYRSRKPIRLTKVFSYKNFPRQNKKQIIEETNGSVKVKCQFRVMLFPYFTTKAPSLTLFECHNYRISFLQATQCLKVAWPVPFLPTYFFFMYKRSLKTIACQISFPLFLIFRLDEWVYL